MCGIDNFGNAGSMTRHFSSAKHAAALTEQDQRTAIAAVSQPVGEKDENGRKDGEYVIDVTGCELIARTGQTPCSSHTS